MTYTKQTTRATLQVGLISGSFDGINADDDSNVDRKSLVDLLEAKGISWKAYQEAYPGTWTKNNLKSHPNTHMQTKDHVILNLFYLNYSTIQVVAILAPSLARIAVSTTHSSRLPISQAIAHDVLTSYRPLNWILIFQMTPFLSLSSILLM